MKDSAVVRNQLQSGNTPSYARSLADGLTPQPFELSTRCNALMHAYVYLLYVAASSSASSQSPLPLPALRTRARGWFCGSSAGAFQYSSVTPTLERCLRRCIEAEPCRFFTWYERTGWCSLDSNCEALSPADDPSGVVYERPSHQDLPQWFDANVSIDAPANGTIVPIDRADMTRIHVKVNGKASIPEDGMICIIAEGGPAGTAQAGRSIRLGSEHQCISDISQPLYWAGPTIVGDYTLVARLHRREQNGRPWPLPSGRAGVAQMSVRPGRSFRACQGGEGLGGTEERGTPRRRLDFTASSLGLPEHTRAELLHFSRELLELAGEGRARPGADRASGIVVLNFCDKRMQLYLAHWADMLQWHGRKDQHVIIAIDSQTSHYCADHGLRCVRWPSSESLAPKVVGYDWVKFFTTLALLDAGVTALVSEMDVVWLRDPLAKQSPLLVPQPPDSSYRYRWSDRMRGAHPAARGELFGSACSDSGAIPDLDISADMHSPRVNVGFFLVRPTVRSTAFFELLVQRTFEQARATAESAAADGHLFHQLEFDALLNNTDFVFGEANASHVLLTDVMRASASFKRPPLCWRRLDHRVFGGADATDGDWHSLWTVHAFGPRQRKEHVLDTFYRWQRRRQRPSVETDGDDNFAITHAEVAHLGRMQALPAQLPQRLWQPTLYQYRAPGLYYSIPAYNAAASGGNFSYSVLVDPHVPLRADVAFCMLDLTGLSWHVDVRDINFDAGLAVQCSNVHPKAGWRTAWQRAAISRGVGGFVALQRLYVAGFTPGRRRVALWLADVTSLSTPLHTPVLYDFHSN